MMPKDDEARALCPCSVDYDDACNTCLKAMRDDPALIHSEDLCGRCKPIAAALSQARRAATLAERERCAGIAANFSKPFDIEWWHEKTKKEISVAMCVEIAIAIRLSAAAQAKGGKGE